MTESEESNRANKRDIGHLKRCNDIRREDIGDLKARVSALEAKVGEGKCDGCSLPGTESRTSVCTTEPSDQRARRTVTYTVSPDVSARDCDKVTIAYRDDEGKTHEDTFVRTPEPQPGDRVKLRDVPVGRWCKAPFGYDDRECAELCKAFTPDGSLQMKDEMGFEWTAVSESTLNTLVTLLPEDYQPEGEGKPEGVTLSVHGSAPVVIPDWARHVRVNSTTMGYHTTTEIEIKA